MNSGPATGDPLRPVLVPLVLQNPETRPTYRARNTRSRSVPQGYLQRRRQHAVTNQPCGDLCVPGPVRPHSGPGPATPPTHLTHSIQPISTRECPVPARPEVDTDHTARQTDIVRGTQEPCPPPPCVASITHASDYQAFCAGWRSGTQRRATEPMASAVIEDVAELLESASRMNRVSRQG